MSVWNRGLRLPREAEAAGPPTLLPPPARVILPLQWGERALVKPGDPVRVGQRIADGAGDTVPVHASVSGRVAAVAPRVCAGGARYPAIVLESDGTMTPDPSVRPRPLLDGMDDALLFDLLRESGVRLPDGAPLYSAVDEAGPGLEALILCAVDPEPGRCAENAALRFETENVLSGIRVLERLARPRRTVLAVRAGQPAALRAAERWTGPRLRLAVLPDRYPYGNPRQLAERLGGVAPGQTAREGGALVVPASAAAGVGRSFYEGMPAVRQTVGVAWPGGRALVSAPLGTAVAAVLAAADPGPGRLLLGGAMTGAPLDDATAPLTQGMDALTLLEPQTPPRRTACIRCGRCEAVCPMGLQPWQSQLRRGRRNWAGCIRCGACQYSCPAGLPLLRAMERRGKEVAGVG